MFNFPIADREQIQEFRRNFLKSVTIQLKFPINNGLLEHKDEVLKFFSDDFPRHSASSSTSFEVSFKGANTPIISPTDVKEDGYEIKSADGKRAIRFEKTGITINIAGDAYSNFPKQKVFLQSINEILNKCSVTVLNRVAIRKINIIEFLVPDGTPPGNIGNLIFAPGLISNYNYFPSDEFLSQNIHTLNYEKESSRLIIRYGTIVPDRKNMNEGHIVVDIDRFNQNEIDTVNFIAALEDINKEIFNVFIWALNPEALKHLK